MAVQITKAQIQQLADNIKTRVRSAVIFRLQFIGEQFVANGRQHGNYKDHTGNLRSSIGYVLMEDGLQLNSDFKKLAPIGPDVIVGKNDQGMTQAQEVSLEVSRDFPKGLVLICVAGMEYAAAVESLGYDVISNSVSIAQADFKQGISRIKSFLQDGAE